MKICVIIVLFRNSNTEIHRLRKEIEDIKGRELIVIIVDNTKDNKGYAYGVNIGMRKAIKQFPHIFIISNPDISISNLKLRNIISAEKYFDIWGFAMKQEEKVYYGGTVDRWRMSGGLIERKPKKRFVSVDFVSGSLMVIKREVIEKIGLFEEKYFMYYEDVEFCERARRAGFNVGIDTGIMYEHYEQSKTNTSKPWYLWRNRLWFLLEYGSMKQKLYELVRLPKTIKELLFS